MHIKNLTKTYKLKNGTIEALKGISFDLPDTGMVFVLGKSGCGKSTLLNVLSGLDSFDGGDIIFNGKSLKSFTPAELDDYRNTCCGFVFQEYNLIPELNVYDNIALPLEMQGEKEVSDKVKNALNAVGLREYETRKITELSGGQKQRVAIARSIVKEPQIIFADEPSGALDSETGASIFELLKELSKDKLVIVVSHDGEAATKYGDRVIELSDGKIVGDTSGNYKENYAKCEIKNLPSKMPLKSALKIGCSNFKYHPIRLIATVLLAVFSFTFLGLALAFATFDKVTPYVDAIYDNGYKYLTITKGLSVPEDNGFSIDGLVNPDSSFRGERVPITAKDTETLQQFVSEELMRVERIYSFISGNYLRTYDQSFSMFIENSDEFISSEYSGIMTLTEDVINEYNFELIGNLPKEKNEVVICEQHYNVYKHLGYKDEEGNEYEINSPADIIGCTVNAWDGSMIVTGVLKTGCDRACYNNNHKRIKVYGASGNEKTPDPNNNPVYFALEDEYLFHEKIFVTEDFISEKFSEGRIDLQNNYILIRVPKDKKEFKALTKFMVSYNNYGYATEGEHYNFTELNPTTEWFDGVLWLGKPLSNLALYIGIIFLVFAVVLLLNFITTSLRSQMKQIGIISALGADFKQLYKIYAISSLILCGIVFALSLVIVGIGVAWLNSTGWANLWFNMTGMSFKILRFNFATIITMFAVSIITALVGTFISLSKMRKLSPAEIIRRGLIK